MTLREWAEDAQSDIREEGLIYGSKAGAEEFYLGMWRRLGKHVNYGRRIYDYNWDLLIILDACRADLIAEVVNEYDFLTAESTYSCASSSGEWHNKNFKKEYSKEMSETALVSGNLHTEDRVLPEDLLYLDRVWEHSFNDEEGTILAEDMVNRTVRAYRKYNPDRLISHFMQPHWPFVPKNGSYGEGIPRYHSHTPWETAWDYLKDGKVSKEKVWEEYKDNLRYALDNVEVLLNNIDAEKVIITADHGNLLGEFGLYDHPSYVPIPTLKRVPWVVTSASDSGEFTVDESEGTNLSVEEKLRTLGYK
jgi:hypothetical protein